MRILVTGTRQKLTEGEEWRVLSTVLARIVTTSDAEYVFVHGACSTGVDAWVEEVYGEDPFPSLAPAVRTEPHPADWSLGRKAGPLRNQEMVDSGIDLVLAFPKGESPGTRGTIRMAEKAGLKVIVTEL